MYVRGAQGFSVGVVLGSAPAFWRGVWWGVVVLVVLGGCVVWACLGNGLVTVWPLGCLRRHGVSWFVLQRTACRPLLYIGESVFCSERRA